MPPAVEARSPNHPPTMGSNVPPPISPLGPAGLGLLGGSPPCAGSWGGGDRVWLTHGHLMGTAPEMTDLYSLDLQGLAVRTWCWPLLG